MGGRAAAAAARGEWCAPGPRLKVHRSDSLRCMALGAHANAATRAAFLQITAWGVTWSAPFAVPLKRMVSGGARIPAASSSASPTSASGVGGAATGAVAAAAAAAAPAGRQQLLPRNASAACPGSAAAAWVPAGPMGVHVLPPLPLVKVGG